MFEGQKDKMKPPTGGAAPAAARVRVRSEIEPIVAGFFAYGAIILALVYTFSASVLFYSNFKVEGHGSWVYIIGGIAVAMGDAAFLTIIIRNYVRGKKAATVFSFLLWIFVMVASMVAEAGLFAAVIKHQDTPAAAASAKYQPAKEKVARLKRELEGLEKRTDLGAPADLEAELAAALAAPAINEKGEEIRANVRQVTRWPDGCQKSGFYARTYCPALLAKSSKLTSAKRLDAIRGGMNLDGTPRVGLLEQAEKELEALGPEPSASVPLFRLMSEATGDSEAKWTLVMIFVLAGAVHMILTFGVWVANEALLEDPEARAARLAALAAIKAESEAAISRAEHEAELAKLTEDLNAELDRLRLSHNAELARAVENGRADLEAQILALKAENERQAAEAVRMTEEALKRASDAANEPARPNYEKGLPPETLDEPKPITIEEKPTPEPVNNEPAKPADDPAPDPDPDAPATGDGDLSGLNLGAGDPDPDPANPSAATPPATVADATNPATEGKPLGGPGGDGGLDDGRPGPGGALGGVDGVKGVTDPARPEETTAPARPTATIDDAIPAPVIDLSRMTRDEEQTKIDEMLLR